MAKTVCVTGASGYIASHVVQQLLDQGYNVRGTVRDVNNESKTAHLKALKGSDRLELFAADLLDGASFATPLTGCDACMHVASPFFNKDFGEAEVEMAVKGTLHVLEACKTAGVKTVVVTSSVAAVLCKGGEPADHVWTEADFSDPAFCRENKIMYPLSKILAENAAWDFVKKNNDPFRMVVINPTLVNGPMLQPSLNTSSGALLDFYKGAHEVVPSGFMSWVDVRDIAKAHVKAMEDESANGRYNMVAGTLKWTDCLEIMRKALPSHADKLPTKVGVAGQEPPNRYNQAAAKSYDVSKVEEGLGVKMRPMGESIAEHVSCDMFKALLD